MRSESRLYGVKYDNDELEKILKETIGPNRGIISEFARSDWVNRRDSSA
jgi:hypothetical protein